MSVFQMYFKVSQETIVFDEEKHKSLSILDVVNDAGLSLRAGCRNGYCKACSISLISGEVKYFAGDPMDMDDEECLLCSCVPKSDLVFDA